MNGSALPRRLVLAARRYEKGHVVEEHFLPVADPVSFFSFFGAMWKLTLFSESAELQIFKLEMLSGTEVEVALALDITFTGWHRDCYLLMPGAVYAGNRFSCRPYRYPPMLTEPSDLGLGKGPFITDVPRLNDGDEASVIQLLSGGMASPHVGIFDPRLKQGLLVMFDPFRQGRESGVVFRESSDRRKATLSLSSPGVRAGTRYVCCTTQAVSRDRGCDLKPGDSLSLRVGLSDFSGEAVPDLFDHLLQSRTCMTGPVEFTHELPFSAAWDILETKYNRDNWNPEGYYRVGMGENRHQDFQTGWVGGLMNTLALLHEGSELSCQRALRTLDFVLARGGSGPSGFFHGIYHRGAWSGGWFRYRPANAARVSASGT